MDNLIKILKHIETLDIPDSYDSIINTGENIDLLEKRVALILKEAENLASCNLICDQGNNNWTNHEILMKAGFDVFAGEKDRFGWLSGCIQTKKGIIVYD